MPLYCITGPPPDDVDVRIIAPDPLQALRLFHAEAFGSDRSVRLIDGALVFRNPAHQQMVAGEWTICRQSVNDGTAALKVEIPEPD
jgi:hypothetical protein